MTGSFERYYKSGTDAFNGVTQNAVTSIDDMIANMKARDAAYEQVWRNIEILTAAGVDQGLIQPLVDGSYRMADQSQHMVDNLDRILGEDGLQSVYEANVRRAMERAALEALDPQQRLAVSSLLAFDDVAAAIMASENVPVAFEDKFREAQAAVEAAMYDPAMIDAANEALDRVREAIEIYELDPALVALWEDAEESFARAAESPIPPAAMQDALNTIDEVVNSHDSLRTSVEGLVRDTYDAAAQQVESSDFSQIGSNIPQAMSSGMEAGTPWVRGSALRTAAELLEGYNNAGVPQTMQESGQEAGRELAGGVESEYGNVADAGRRLAEECLNACADAILQDQSIDNETRQRVTAARDTALAAVAAAGFSVAGFNMAQGIATGILSGTSVVNAAARKIINSALASMRKAAATNSPSRRTMEIADDLADGLLVQTLVRLKDVEESGTQVMDAYLGGAKGAYRTKGGVHSLIDQSQVAMVTNKLLQTDTGPFAAMAKALEGAILNLPSKLLGGVPRAGNSVSTVTNAPHLELVLNYYGDGSEDDAYTVGEMFADAIRRETRSLGIEPI
ncbi:MAG: hypothetical protein FWE08_03855 [Oscillospiraceae bacterium]|nr:hypothetical protein [Oscillospiraceae bacterium]